MKIMPLMSLIFMSLLIQSCATSSDFDVKTVDAISHKPISGVKVEHSTLHYTGVKTAEVEVGTLGKTDLRGVFKVRELNMYSRTPTLSFLRAGYETMYFVVTHDSNQNTGVIVKKNNEHVGDPIMISKSLIIEIPMRRK